MTHPAGAAAARRRPPPLSPDRRAPVFFFSNRLGCLGSILVSAVLTLILLAVLGVI